MVMLTVPLCNVWGGLLKPVVVLNVPLCMCVGGGACQTSKLWLC